MNIVISYFTPFPKFDVYLDENGEPTNVPTSKVHRKAQKRNGSRDVAEAVGESFERGNRVTLQEIDVLWSVEHPAGPQKIIDSTLQEMGEEIDLWLAFGEAGATDHSTAYTFRLESVATNRREALALDNNGERPVLNDEDASYRCKFNTEALVAEITSKLSWRSEVANFSVQSSSDAGSYICESTAYELYKRAAEDARLYKSLFIHVPAFRDTPKSSPARDSDAIKTFAEAFVGILATHRREDEPKN